MNYLERWLGTTRYRLFIGLLLATGLTSTVLQLAAGGERWVINVQTGLMGVFIAGTLVIVNARLSSETRRRLAFMFVPIVVAIGLGLLIPDLFRLFLGIAVGWFLASQLLMRSADNTEYKRAVKALRRKEYQTAIDEMNALIRRDADQAEHYAFRAQLHRLNDDFNRAKYDYETVLKLDPESSVGANGLAEIYLQKGDLEPAREWAEKAFETAPDEWIAAYNLGMIAERQHDNAAAITYLQQAIDLKIPESRHRLLTYLWLARVYYRQDDQKQADHMIDKLLREKRGLNEWKTILESDEAAHLRGVLQLDVRMAKALFERKSMAYAFDLEG